LALLLVAAAATFGGVYFWAALLLSLATAALLFWTGPRRALSLWTRPPVDDSPADPSLRRRVRQLDLALFAALAGIAIQMVPMPSSLVALVAPARAAYFQTAALQPDLPRFLPLTLDVGATMHAWLAAFCTIGAFWTARAILVHGGNRTLITCLAWAAVGLVILGIALSATGTHLVYGVWHPYDAGARPLGPFVNRNHFGTWSLLVFFLCFGCFQWRREASPRARRRTWGTRIAQALDGRNLILVLALALLAINVALGASRSTMLALACGAGYVAAVAPRGSGTRRSSLWTATLGLAAVFAALAYADIDRVLARLDETRQLGLSQRIAIWRDTLAVVRDFPIFGVGAGNFSNAMRVYQSSDRTYYWNEAHNEFLQIAAEGGLLLIVPTVIALTAMVALTVSRLRRRDDRLLWMRLGAAAALVSVAVQSLWETGVSLPANSMLAGLATAIAIQPSHAPHPASDPDHAGERERDRARPES